MVTVTKIFGFLKNNPKRGIIVDSTDPNQMPGCKKWKLDFGHQHFEFNEETDLDFTDPLMKRSHQL